MYSVCSPGLPGFFDDSFLCAVCAQHPTAVLDVAATLQQKEPDAGDDRPKNPLSGSLAYVRRCTVCDSVSTRMERFVDLSLTLPEARDVSDLPAR